MQRATDVFTSLHTSYTNRWLPWALQRRRLLVVGCVLATLASFAPLMTGAIPSEFQPSTQRGVLTADLSYTPGTPLDITRNGAARLSQAIQYIAGVRHVLTIVGKNNNGSTDVIGGYVAQLTVVLTDEARTKENDVAARIRELTDQVPGAAIAIHGFQMGGKAPISYEVVGADDELAQASNKIAAVIKNNPAATDVHTSLSESGPRLDVVVDQGRASLLGVSPDDVANTVRTAIAGAIATKVRFPEQLVDAVVRLPAAMRADPQVVTADIDVRAADGRSVPIGDVATTHWSTEPSVLQRENRRRVVTVSATTLGGAPVGIVTDQVAQALKSPGFLPSGVSVLPRGDVEQMKEAGADIGLALLTSCLLMYAVLAVLYQGYMTPFIILLTVPIASVGAFGSLWLANVLHSTFPQAPFFAGQTLNLYSMLGIVMLIGLVAKNGILLVDYANTLQRAGLSAIDAMRQSANVRFRPILMTTLSMIAGMLPLALGLSAGAEMRKAMGTVVIGGLTSSLILTLFLIPAVNVRFARVRPIRAHAVDGALEPANLGVDHSQIV